LLADVNDPAGTDTTFVELLYAETVRRLTLQLENLSAIRTRAGALFSAAAVATSLLGGLAANAEKAGRPLVLGPAGWLAISAFFIATGVSLGMFRNLPQLRFTLPRRAETSDEAGVDRRVLGVEDWLQCPEGYPSDKSTAYLEMTAQLEQLYKSNAETMKHLFYGLEILTAAVGVELFAWILELMR
jgi:hypothetical protein